MEVGLLAWMKSHMIAIISAIGGFLFAIFKIGKLVQSVLDRLDEVEADVLELKDSQSKHANEISDLKVDVSSIKGSTERIEKQIDLLVSKLINNNNS